MYIREAVEHLYAPETNVSELQPSEVEVIAHALIECGARQKRAIPRTNGFTVGKLNQVFGLDLKENEIIGPGLTKEDGETVMYRHGVGVWVLPRANVSVE